MDHLSELVETAFETIIKGIDAGIERLCNSKPFSEEGWDLESKILRSAPKFLEKKMAELLLHIQTRLIHIPKQRNFSVSRIYRLPEEIFVEILISAIETSSVLDNERDKVRSRMMCVGWRWVNTIISTPLLSSFLSNLQRACTTKRLLDLSKRVTLDVTCTDQCSEVDAERFMQLVLPHIRRWRSFRLEIWSTRQRDWKLPKLSAPLLEVFQVTSLNYTQQASNPFNGDAPRLRVLGIEPVLISWGSPLLSGLTELDITDIDGEDEQWRKRYYGVFKALPLLEHVNIRLKKELRLNTTDSDAPSYELAMEPIVLSRLRTVKLESLPSRIGVALLSSIVGAPSYPGVSINFSHAKSWLFESISLARPDSIISSIIPRLAGLMIWFKVSEKSLRIWGSFPNNYNTNRDQPAPLMLRFHRLKLPISPAANKFIGLLAKSSLKFLSLQGRVDFEEAGLDLGSILPYLSNLEVLSLGDNDDEDGVHAVLENLYTIYGDEEQGDAWPCEMLRKLTLCNVRFQAKQLLALIKFRYGNSIGLGTNRAFLKELEIRYSGRIGKGERKILGQVEIIVLNQGGNVSLR